MKILLSSLILLALSAISYAQIKFTTYYEQVGNVRVLLADNDEYCPVTHSLELKLNNVKSSIGSKAQVVVPPRTKRFKILSLTRIDRAKPASAGGGGVSNLGDHSIQKYDASFKYYLPVKKGKKLRVWQGYNGTFSHRQTNALDFDMKEGTPIFAIRGGIVAKVVEKYDRGCPSEECKDFNNSILIYHSDGTFAGYSHLRKNGSKVEEGDKVEIGQEIGYSGNTGWSSGPHLHLSVFLQRMNSRETLRTKFLVDKGDKEKFLKENRSYKRKY